jgi:hypothetical protein
MKWAQAGKLQIRRMALYSDMTHLGVPQALQCLAAEHRATADSRAHRHIHQ